MSGGKLRVRWRPEKQRWQWHDDRFGFMRMYLRDCPACGGHYIGGGSATCCRPCADKVTSARKAVTGPAHRRVTSAVKHGQIPKLDGSIPCVDCGAVAQIYEHRDYSKPLDVVPVCRSCNYKRGHAQGIEQFYLRVIAHQRNSDSGS